VVLIWLIVSWLLARFDRQKRWTSYALLVEALTLVLIAALMTGFWKTHRG
jgi:low temperature requirement protein LtrA